MRSLWTDLLFLHGYITDLRLAQRLSNPQPHDKRDTPRQRSARSVCFAWPARLCLGIGDGNVRAQ
jgi:hypothetical protein